MSHLKQTSLVIILIVLIWFVCGGLPRHLVSHFLLTFTRFQWNLGRAVAELLHALVEPILSLSVRVTLLFFLLGAERDILGQFFLLSVYQLTSVLLVILLAAPEDESRLLRLLHAAHQHFFTDS